MTRSRRAFPILVVLAGAGLVVGWRYLRAHPWGPPVTSSSSIAQAAPSLGVQYPVSSGESGGESALHLPTPLPNLQSSDSDVEESLGHLLGKDRLDALLNLKDFIRRVVVSIDSLTGPRQPTLEFSPLKGLSSAFRVSKKGDDISIANSNSARYSAYVSAFDELDAQQLVIIYKHYYPLFQTAYQDLGKAGYFNDRLIQVIDHLLATPFVPRPIELIRPTKHSSYKFADDRVEARSAGQKFLIRMGDENARIIKKKLRQIRALLVQPKVKKRRLNEKS